MERDISAYFSTLARLGGQAEATDEAARPLGLADAFAWVQRKARAAHDSGHKLMFVGNGGSAGIASHCAIDYSKNGDLRSLAFNDGAALTCLGNDLGYENVFARQVEMHGRSGDLLIAISSSGNSPNIHKAVSAARGIGCAVATFSGFKADNPLRSMGDVNFYVASDAYGFVEILHLSLCHAILDLAMGWRATDGSVRSGDLKAESLV
ncbi:SIS domain-containing protein (plasmid) [Azospirillum oryzae]|uniref:SIS domain-containing protein n=1 Tax=Azospirillum oryzae TaxID=286727 RepID=A0A6N1ADC6_9PROT|nr:SIS domain-containing protein [Azospirillum oryzae]KAA0586642.1 SIS domain-containing protein [Azospirillum oryzae]QKS49088.1 SIS domain-containing protein [Azospirillum oryzae]GLR80783.1 phosphoheptose isomerase [Azospirillum oryzae]